MKEWHLKIEQWMFEQFDTTAEMFCCALIAFRVQAKNESFIKTRERNGKVWVKLSSEKIASHFKGKWNRRHISSIMQKLVEDGYILSEIDNPSNPASCYWWTPGPNYFARGTWQSSARKRGSVLPDYNDNIIIEEEKEAFPESNSQVIVSDGDKEGLFIPEAAANAGEESNLGDHYHGKQVTVVSAADYQAEIVKQLRTHWKASDCRRLAPALCVNYTPEEIYALFAAYWATSPDRKEIVMTPKGGAKRRDFQNHLKGLKNYFKLWLPGEDAKYARIQAEQEQKPGADDLHDWFEFWFFKVRQFTPRPDKIQAAIERVGRSAPGDIKTAIVHAALAGEVGCSEFGPIEVSQYKGESLSRLMAKPVMQNFINQYPEAIFP